MGQEAVDFEKRFHKAFPNAVRAVSEKDDLDFLAVLGRVFDDDDQLRVTLMPDPDKDFSFIILNIEEKEDEWIVTTPKQRWAWRQAPEERGKLLIRQMDEYDG